MIAPKRLLRRVAAARIWAALCNRRFPNAIKASIGAAAALLGRLLVGLAVGRPGLVMDQLPDRAQPYEQVAGDEEAAGDGLEADDQRAVAEDRGMGVATGDGGRFRIAENALPAAHHLLAAQKRLPARM